jgi:hypothetical protein
LLIVAGAVALVRFGSGPLSGNYTGVGIVVLVLLLALRLAARLLARRMQHAAEPDPQSQLHLRDL